MRRLLLALLLFPLLAHAEPAELDWLELMPPEDRKALEAMPEISHDSPEAVGTFGQQGGLKQEQGLPAVMYSKKTVARLDGKHVRLGGYPVPLESDVGGKTTLLFLVPYPGACIHVPRHRRTRSCWCAIPRASCSTISTNRCGSMAPCASKRWTTTWPTPPTPWMPAPCGW